MEKSRKKYIFYLIAFFCSSLNSVGQIRNKVEFPAPKHEVLLLGTFHFNYPGLDQVKATDRFKVDVLATPRQQQLEKLVQQLSRFNPTLILVEGGRPEDQLRIDSLYQEYLKGGLRDKRGELYQIGFRLGKYAGHKKIYTIDALPFNIKFSHNDSVIYNKYSDYVHKDYPLWDSLYSMFHYEDDSLAFVSTFQQYLLHINSTEELKRSHNQYFRYLRKGSSTEPVGADGFITKWYNRNLRIFSNILRQTGDKPERILVIFGAGHMPILKHLLSNSMEFKVRELSEYIKQE